MEEQRNKIGNGLTDIYCMNNSLWSNIFQEAVEQV